MAPSFIDRAALAAWLICLLAVGSMAQAMPGPQGLTHTPSPMRTPFIGSLSSTGHADTSATTAASAALPATVSAAAVPHQQQQLPLVQQLMTQPPVPHVISQWEGRDFVCVFASHTPRLDLVRGSRAWRMGQVPAIVFMEEMPQPALDALMAEGEQHQEVYLTWPDDPLGEGRGPKPSDTRAALAPFLAVRYLQEHGRSFKWMLYGDDDTLWVMHGVLRLLEGWDPAVPVAISDDYWPAHPNTNFFRCLPCHGALRDRLPPRLPVDKPAFNATPGCPCRAELLLGSGCPGLGSPNGGGGIILSRALFDTYTIEQGGTQ